MTVGIDGARDTQNFPGFVNQPNPYMFWDAAQFTTWDNTTWTTRAPRSAVEGHTYRNKPTGPSAMTVYTDEHGEAQVEF